MKLAVIFITTIDFLVVFIISFFAGFWWLIDSTSEMKVEIFQSSFMLLCLYAFIYEEGYKKTFIGYGTKQQFYLIFLLPGLIATCGYLYGLIRS